MEQQKRNQRSITITLVILLLISFSWNVFQLFQHDTAVKSFNQQIDSLIIVRVDLGSELLATSNELNNYMGIAANLDSVVTEANGKIKEQQEKIQALLKQGKNSENLIKQLRQELAELRKLKDEYLEKIDELITENLALQRENMVLSHNVAALSVEKVDLQEKVSTGSKIKVEYVQISASKKKRNNKYTPTSLAKKTNMLEACFSLLENQIARAGEKTVYLRIITPEGLPLGNKLVGSGTFKTASGEEVMYTSSQEVDYEKKKLDLCMTYEEEGRILTPGTYLFEIYVDKKLSSVSSYLLR